MNYRIKLLVSLILLASHGYVFAMDSSEKKEQSSEDNFSPFKLTPEETACYQWFEANKKACGDSGYMDLSKEDRESLQKGSVYKDQPQTIKNIMDKLAENFYKRANNTYLNVRFDANTLSSALFKIKGAMRNEEVAKPTDALSARIYVFTKLLTADEKATMLQDNYLKNPAATHAAMTKCGVLLADQLAALKIISNTDVEKAKSAQEFLTNKMAELKRVYSKPE